MPHAPGGSLFGSTGLIKKNHNICIKNVKPTHVYGGDSRYRSPLSKKFEGRGLFDIKNVGNTSWEEGGQKLVTRCLFGLVISINGDEIV